MWTRYLARQFARPDGPVGRWLIGPWLDRIAQPMNRLAFQALELRSSDRVVEVGFGGGDLLQWVLAGTSAQQHGVDPSAAMRARARRRFRKEIRQGRLRIVSGSAECVPLPDSSADKACSVNSIYFWSDPQAAMREFARLLVPGGRLVLALQTPEAVRAWPGHRYGFRAYDPDEVRALMKGGGFRDIEVSSGSEATLRDFVCLSGTQPTSSR